MKQQTGAFIEKSRGLLGQADTMLAVGLTDAAGRTAYLAGLHAAQALIFERTSKVIKRHRVDELTCLFENVRTEVGQPIHFRPAVGQVVEEDRDVVIRTLSRITARTGPKQHHALDPVAVHLVESGAEALENRIIVGPDNHAGQYTTREPRK